MKILIVEDEILIALEIKKYVEKLGYLVTSLAKNYDECLSSFKNDFPDIIIMDIILKNSISGIEIAKIIKKIKNIPIIFLSAYSDDIMLKKASIIFPEAYLIKPFNRNDLKSALFIAKEKSDNNHDKNNYVDLREGYFYDKVLNQVYYNGLKMKLSKNELLLLKILINAKGEIVSFETIENIIWSDKSVSDSAVRTLLHRLRNRFNHKIIETIHTFGCKLI
ncbi:response regulator transcription factor [Halarcobacter anaerophilus]|uniref:DNA-binding response regulator n=1 Tax=Halarcobacter anaerophilus TaxID=877500 RepID=A0A4Q0Y0G7_9BACT|nr:DNA-binding response regulator [Halarcobacter anaerophilus]QDF28870.1 two-component system response regulator [Halarcobacter anaerophilus]RXJ63510.1 DNA-binding response regulator [Halarcobacter anaerophilus]